MAFPSDVSAGDDILASAQNNSFNYLCPTATIVQYGGTTAPTDWLECNGTAVSRTTYSDLFSAIGTSFGTGDGSTTFNLPDFQNKFIMGRSGSRAVGTTGGADTVTISEANLPVHSHPVTVDNESAHTHVIGVRIAECLQQSPSGSSVFNPSNFTTAPSSSDAGTAHKHTASSGNIGSGTATTIIPSFLSSMTIIKT